MNQIIWQYIVPAVYVLGLAIVITRFHHTRSFVAGFLAFVLLLAPATSRWLIAGTERMGGIGLRVTLYLGWLLGTFLILTTVAKIKQPEKTKAASFIAIASAIAVLLALVSTSIIAVIKGGSEFVGGTAAIAFWVTIVLGVLAIFGNYSGSSSDKSSIGVLLGGIIGMGILLFALILCVRSIWTLSHGSWLVVLHRTVPFLSALVFLGCASAVLRRFSGKWFGVCAVAGFSVLAVIQLVVFANAAADLTISGFSSVASLASLFAWLAILLFFVAVPQTEMASLGAWAGFRMTEARWGGVAAIVVGLLICAWQMYEVHGGEHLTLWMVGGFIPLPVIVLGVLAILGGVIALIQG
jgi:hypothetical protein